MIQRALLNRTVISSLSSRAYWGGMTVLNIGETKENDSEIPNHDDDELDRKAYLQSVGDPTGEFQEDGVINDEPIYPEDWDYFDRKAHDHSLGQ